MTGKPSYLTLLVLTCSRLSPSSRQLADHPPGSAKMSYDSK